MSDLFNPIPEEGFIKPLREDKDPFEVKNLRPVFVRSGDKISMVFADENNEIPIESDIPFLDMVDAQPGVPSVVNPLNPHRVERTITLRGANEDVKEFVEDIKADRMLKEEQGKFHIDEFRYDVDMVRIFGQYQASQVEMSAYFGVNVSIIAKLMNDEESDFYLVYQKSKSLLCMSLRQTRIKGALAGSERLLIHLGKHILDQKDDTTPKAPDRDLSADSKKRRVRIKTLTMHIEEFED